MFWTSDADDDENALQFSPALVARRASESWIDTLPLEEAPLAVQAQRKKSMPDFERPSTASSPEAAAAAAVGMSREEVSALSSARREELRRLREENRRLRANPLLYLLSPRFKEWFAQRRLLLLVVFVNASLAALFYKLLTMS